jgi:hypothetical protein
VVRSAVSTYKGIDCNHAHSRARMCMRCSSLYQSSLQFYARGEELADGPRAKTKAANILRLDKAAAHGGQIAPFKGHGAARDAGKMLIIPPRKNIGECAQVRSPFSDNLAIFYGRFLISSVARVSFCLLRSSEKNCRVCSNLFHTWMLLFIPSVREICSVGLVHMLVVTGA